MTSHPLPRAARGADAAKIVMQLDNIRVRFYGKYFVIQSIYNQIIIRLIANG